MLNALFNLLRSPKNASFLASSASEARAHQSRHQADANIITAEIIESPFTRPLYEAAYYNNGRRLRFVRQKMPSMTYGEYDFERNHVLTNTAHEPTRVVVSHELRHAWQDAAFDRYTYLAADPYTHFMYRQIAEADAVAFANVAHGMMEYAKAHPHKAIPMKRFIAQYKQDFIEFLNGASFAAADGKNVNSLSYRIDHLRSAATYGQPFSWVYGNLKKYETPLPQPEMIDPVIRGLKLFSERGEPIDMFTAEEAAEIRVRLYEIHSKNNVTGPKLNLISENLYGHYGIECRGYH